MYWASSVGGAIWAESGQMPAHKLVRESKEYLALPFAKNYGFIVPDVVFLPKIPAASYIHSIMTQNFDLVWNGTAAAGEAVDAINKQLQELIDNQ
jgi:maltose-binding protein MalE